jgi:hypothetical protein
MSDPYQGISNDGTVARLEGINNDFSREGRGVGVHGSAETGEGVLGETNSLNFSAVAGFQKVPESIAAAVFGQSGGNSPGLQGISATGPGVMGEGSPAGLFQGVLV